MPYAAAPSRLRAAAARLAAALLVAAAPVAAGGATPFGSAEVRVRETGLARVYEQGARVRSRIDVRIRPGSAAKPSSLSVRLGGFSADVPLVRGRYTGRVAAAPIETTARVTTRRGVVTASLRVRARDGGAVLGDRAARRAADEQISGGLLYDLAEGSIAVDGVATNVALSAVARFDFVPRPGHEDEPTRGTGLFRADVVGAAISQLSAPVVQVVPETGGATWEGRVRGHALAVGGSPRVSAQLSGGAPRLLVPLDDEARDASESDVAAPGVRSIDVEGVTYFQMRFDTAVQCAPGPQRLVLTAFDRHGGDAEAVVKFDMPPAAPPVSLSAGTHVLEVRRDQSVWASGDNLFGQVGDGTRLTPFSPVRLAAPAAARQVSAGGDFSLALDVAGGAWRWGEWSATRELRGDVFVTVDDGTKTPEPVEDLTGLVALAAGADHLLALDAEGEVWSMGENYSGQLGVGTFDDHARRPQHVRGLPRIREIAAGEISLALDEDGGVWTWGAQLLAGIGDATRPVRVAGLPPVRTISAGTHALCLAEDGTVWTWGRNQDGALGDRTDVDRDAPVQVADLAGVVAIDAGDFHSLAVRGDGTVWAWGSNSYGELGDGTSADRTFPVQVLDLEGVAAVAAGSFVSLAVDATGAVWVWGRYEYATGVVGSGGEEFGVYPMLARREHTPGHFPKAPPLILFAK